MDYLARAAKYCSQSEHCAYDVKQKLFQWGCCDTNEQSKVIDYLTKEKFIEEERYCRAFVHDKMLYQGWGRIKLRMALREKRLTDSAIDMALDTINDEEYMTILSRLIEQKKRQTKGECEQQKLLKFALSRGFTYDEISKII